MQLALQDKGSPHKLGEVQQSPTTRPPLLITGGQPLTPHCCAWLLFVWRLVGWSAGSGTPINNLGRIGIDFNSRQTQLHLGFGEMLHVVGHGWLLRDRVHYGLLHTARPSRFEFG